MFARFHLDWSLLLLIIFLLPLPHPSMNEVSVIAHIPSVNEVSVIAREWKEQGVLRILLHLYLALKSIAMRLVRS